VSLRAARRAVALGAILALSVVRYWLARLRGPLSMESRALWVQKSCRQVLASMGIPFRVEGSAPTHGLVVSNHLSYLDVLILSAAMPCFFVAKMEIDRWPFFGWAARMGGTIFLNRSSMASNNSVARQIDERLKLPVPVLLFPEGTSTDGSHVLRFHARLIAPAVAAGAPITAAAIRYVAADGTPERELCWFGDVLFLPHLLKTLGTAGFSAMVSFGPPRLHPDNRAAASHTHAEIVDLRRQLLSSPRF
jgi:1-acyl-sn-glycerol-3-phosphate acyltransferase